MRSLDEWLRFQEQAYPRVIELGLQRLQQVLQRLHWQPPRAPVITVAGTNGKGSVSCYCAEILRAAGYRVGLFTSPHLHDYRERIRIAGECAHATDLVQVFERIETARAEIGLTFFEYNTLAALLLFEAAALDVWVLEIGLGGRLDAVNVVDADVAVVVSIGFDHQEFLGNTLEQIGAEKAGIFRPGKTAVLGSVSLPASVERIARDVGARLKRMGQEFNFERALDASHWGYRGERWNFNKIPQPALFGAKQVDNAAIALAALEALGERITVTPAAIARGLLQTRLPGRFQMFAPLRENSPPWILDVAHNPAAAQVLAQNLRAAPCRGKTLAICGMLADKDTAAIIAELKQVMDEWWLATTHGARGLSDAQLLGRMNALLTQPLHLGGELSHACAAALASAGPLDRIVVFGSFYTVGPALDWLQAQRQTLAR